VKPTTPAKDVTTAASTATGALDNGRRATAMGKRMSPKNLAKT